MPVNLALKRGVVGAFNSRLLVKILITRFPLER